MTLRSRLASASIHRSAAFAAWVLFFPFMPAADADIVRQHARPFPVSDRNGTPIEYPFLGGWFDVKPLFVDIDADGDDDLFVVRPYPDDRVSFYRNIGNAVSPEFAIAEDGMRDMRVLSFASAVDIDGDGDFDFVADADIGIVVHENAGTPQAHRFVRSQPDYLASLPHFGQVGVASFPAFGDLDGDGDPDFLYVNAPLGTAVFHENTGTSAAPRFAPGVDGWGGISTAGGKSADTRPHGNSSLTIADLSGGALPDLLIGDITNPGVWHFENRSANGEAVFDLVTRNLLADRTFRRNTTAVADLDTDGTEELYVCPEGAESASFRVYEPVDPGDSLKFALRDSVFLPCIDLGVESRAALADLDDDGDLDLVMTGGRGFVEARIALFENLGTRTAPEFEQAGPGESPFAAIGADVLREGYLAPAFGDLDADGDPDLVLGTYYSLLRYENVGTPAAPQFTNPEPLGLDGFGGDNAYAPALGDIDCDGDLDLVVGERGGGGTPRLFVYRNDGGVTHFEPALVSNNSGREFFDHGLDGSFDFENRRFVPAFVHLDRDSCIDLAVGYGYGRVRAGINRHAATGAFVFERSRADLESIDIGVDAAPAFGDLDGDGDDDLLLGELSGGINWFETVARDLRAARSPDGSVALSWIAGDAPGLAFRMLRRSGDASGFETVASGITPGSSLTNVWADTTALGNAAYEYRLAAEYGDSILTATDSVASGVLPFVFAGLELRSASDSSGVLVTWEVVNQRPDARFALHRTSPLPEEFTDPVSVDGVRFEIHDEGVPPGSAAAYDLSVVLEGDSTQLARDTIFVPIPAFSTTPIEAIWVRDGYELSWAASRPIPLLGFEVHRAQKDTVVLNTVPITSDAADVRLFEYFDGTVALDAGARYELRPLYWTADGYRPVPDDRYTGGARTIGARSFRLLPVRPNPVLPRGQQLRISLQMPAAGRARIEIFNVQGRRVFDMQADLAAGPDREMFWNLRNSAGEDLAPGKYFIRGVMGGSSDTRAIVLVR